MTSRVSCGVKGAHVQITLNASRGTGGNDALGEFDVGPLKAGATVAFFIQDSNEIDHRVHAA